MFCVVWKTHCSTSFPPSSPCFDACLVGHEHLLWPLSKNLKCFLKVSDWLCLAAPHRHYFYLLEKLTQSKLCRRSRVSRGLKTLILLLEVPLRCVLRFLSPTWLSCRVEQRCCVLLSTPNVYFPMCVCISRHSWVCICMLKWRSSAGLRWETPLVVYNPPQPICLSSWVAHSPPCKSLLWLSSPAFYVSSIQQSVSS